MLNQNSDPQNAGSQNAGSQNAGPQYLEDLATGYWFSEVLFTAVELEIFTHLNHDGRTIDEIAPVLGVKAHGLERFLRALCTMGLLHCRGGRYFNSEISGKYLVAGLEEYQGNSILWRKELLAGWQDLKACLAAGGRVNYPPAREDQYLFTRRIRQYITAMDCVARTKVQEILAVFAGFSLAGEILDVGAGSGALAAGFLERFPSFRATLMDLPEVLDFARELMSDRGYGQRVNYCPANILEDWPVGNDCFDLIILSNIIHAYSETEVSAMLERAVQCLKPGGIMMIHDFFLEHYPAKAALFDLNMFINTYNGRVFSQGWIKDRLMRLGLYTSESMPLATDTELIFAARNEASLGGLCKKIDY